MAYPKLEIYPRAKTLDGTEDVLISQGKINKKVSTQAIADLAAAMGTAGSGTVPTWGDVSAFSDGDLLAIDGGVLVKASNNDAAKMPCIGVFEEGTDPMTDPDVIRTTGRGIVFTGLAADIQYYVGVNGALTATPPSTSGTISQRVCIGTGVNAAFVQIGEPILNT